MRMVVKVFAALIGAVFGIASGFALAPALAAFASKESAAGPGIFMLAMVVLGILLGVFAPTIRRTFGRGFLLLGVCVLALPISTLLLTGRATNDVVQNAEAGNEAAVAVGAGLASIAVTGVAAFVGVFLGAILIIIGLVLALGGRREVVVVGR